MEELERTGDEITVRASPDELRLILGAVNESLNGPYAIPADEWGGLVGQPPERGERLIDALMQILER